MSVKVAVVSNDLVLSEKILLALDTSYIVKTFSFPDRIWLKNNLSSTLCEFSPDVIVIDMISLLSDFFEVLRIIRNTIGLEDKKVLVMSQSKRIDLIVGQNPRIKGYMKKPVDFDELKRMIESIIPKGGRVAVIDDDEEFSELLRIFLVSNGYDVVVINNPFNLVLSVSLVNVDLILLDLLISGKDGFDILFELASNKDTSNIPVIVISAIEFNILKTKGISGYCEYIARDLEPQKIKEIIDNALTYGYQLDEKKSIVLLADDQLDLLMLMKESIEKAGFDVITATDGGEAIEKVLRFSPDVVVLDYDMPVKNGLDVAVEMKNNPVYSHIPVIILTARIDKQTKIKGLLMGIDDYMTKPVDTDELIARLKMIIKRNKQVLDSNPLSKLPGNPSIQARIEKAIRNNERFAVLYIDLNNFKAYNDVYGFEAGDNVIKTLANIIVNTVMPTSFSGDFVGHIGGDDFIVVTSIDKAEELAKRIINNFNQIVPSFYNETDRKNGYITAYDRQGRMTKFPLMGLAIGIVHNMYKPLKSYAQVSHIGSELKKAAKMSGKSSYMIDRRRE